MSGTKVWYFLVRFSVFFENQKISLMVSVKLANDCLRMARFSARLFVLP